MPKFFIDSNQIHENTIVINGKDVNHIKNVLRKKVGNSLEICNKVTGKNYLAEISEIESEYINCKIINSIETYTESCVYISIYQGLPKSDKMELIIQKSVELGASEINPVAMKRCVVKLNGKDEIKKIERWQKISEVASKQSGRNVIPKINGITTIKEICNNMSEYDVVLVAYENEKENTLKNELEILKNKNKKALKIAIVIGPEGGIESDEIEMLKETGARIVTLGNRILRTETVALNMISIINYVFDA